MSSQSSGKDTENAAATPRIAETGAGDLTTADINELYGGLQRVLDQVTTSTESTPHISPSLPISPALSSSPGPPSQAAPEIAKDLSSPLREEEKLEDCPCLHIFNPGDLTRCALCERPLSHVGRLQEDVKQKAERTNKLQAELDDTRASLMDLENNAAKASDSRVELEKRLSTMTDQMHALERDMHTLNDKYVKEIERVAELQHAKEMVESELEDLSQRLFEEANGMVATEKREKANLQIAYEHLQNRLNETREQLAAEEMQLKELRDKMQRDKDCSESFHRSSSLSFEQAHSPANVAAGVTDASIVDDPDKAAAMDLAELFAENLRLSLSSRTNPEGIDPIMLEEFRDFVSIAATLPLKKLQTTSFLKFCIAEDVEPCLRFGPNTRLSARKLIDAIIMNTCFIEDAPHGFAEEQARRPDDAPPLRISALKFSMWDRFTDSSALVGCQACGRSSHQASLPYRFRISYFDDWACIDRFCRDRLVAVCEYFVFIRNVRQGYYSSRSIPDLFHEATRLRLQMFYAR